MIKARIIAGVLACAMLAALAGVTGAAASPVQPSPAVSQPVVEGPVPHGVGIRSGRPYGESLLPLPAGWVEEEFFYSGTAYSAPGKTGTSAAYKSRFLVRRPADAADFNGTLVFEWNNVTIPHDHDATWQNYWQTTFERGYVYISVAAQLLSIEASPIALKQWDPVRYASLSHPGDTYSFDIYQQSAEAALNAAVLDDLRPLVERRIAMGASQSGGRLHTYINTWHEPSQVFDGYQPQVSGPGGVRRDLAPILWLNSQSEIGATQVPADDGLFRLWELSGPAHTTGYSNNYRWAMLAYAHSNGAANIFDSDEAGAWGYQLPPGACGIYNHFLAGPIWGAALVALDDWIRTGVAPAPQPRAERDAAGRVYDQYGNLKGGVRSALLDVPIATYYAGGVPATGEPCAAGGAAPLTGVTKVFDPLTLAALYPTPESYLQQFEASLDDMMAAGTLLPEGKAEYMRRAMMANVGGASNPPL